MKKLLLMLAAVATLFTACTEECNHDFIEVDYSKDLVGTWTCLTADYAEALVIKADGSVVSTGVENGEYWDGVKGSIKTTNNKMTLLFEDNDNYEGRFEMICGEAFTIFDENGKHLTYRYCANDLADEIVGMWVCNEGLSGAEKDMGIITYSEDGKAMFTGNNVTENNDNLLGLESTYKVVGNILFQTISYPSNSGVDSYMAIQLTYAPNGISLGDIMTQTTYLPKADGVHKSISSWVRVKEGLNLTGKTYDYKSAYVTNAKGKDEDFTIMGNTFNIAKIKGYDFDKMFSANLFCVELNANSFKYKLRLDNGQYTGFDTPMTIDGNKVTLDMSAINPALRKVEMHMFQDANDTQVHFYMHTDAFINYFANMEVYTLIMEGKINQTDEAAIAKVFADMEARVESINVSFTMKARK